MSIMIPYRKLDKPLVGCELNLSHTMSENLIFRYILNEKGGRIIYDMTNRYNSTSFNNSPIWKENGLEFNGSNTYVNINNPLSAFSFIQNTRKFAIAVRFRLNDLNTRQMFCGSVLASAEKGFFLGWETFDATLGDHALRLFISHGVSGEWQDFRTPNNATINDKLVHTAVFNVASTTSVGIYLDGRAMSLTSNSVSPTLSSGDSTRTLIIGASNHSTPGLYFSGIIEDIMLFNKNVNYDIIFELTYNPFANIIAPLYRSYFFLFNSTLSRRRLQGTQNTPRIIGPKGVGVF